MECTCTAFEFLTSGKTLVVKLGVLGLGTYMRPPEVHSKVSSETKASDMGATNFGSVASESELCLHG